jgi:hypothetical protein
MVCVSSVRYQVWMDNSYPDFIYPTRGLCLGDPLSLYLFFLCAEGLTNLLKFEENVGNLLGVKVCRGAPVVSHIPFLWETSSVSGALELSLEMTWVFSWRQAVVASHSYLIRRRHRQELFATVYFLRARWGGV